VKLAATVRPDIYAKNVADRYVNFALNQTHGFAQIVATILSGKLRR